jgi:OmpA-OmpF porin, OOP family
MKKLEATVFLAGAMALAMTCVVPTASAQPRADSGWYVGGSFGQSEVDIEDCGGGIDCDEKDTAWRIFGGYKINRNFSVEAGYHQLGEARASGPGGNIEFDANALELVALGALPLGNQFSLYGKAGFYRGETKVTGSTLLTGPLSIKETNTDLTYGVGVQYDMSRQLGIRAEWQRYADMGDDSIGKTDVDVMSIGVVFRFQ